ncbi:hypothetical protein AZE42_11952 [Rhizopogon vesiculosus]|uniref:XPG-I domain-containing protein n=1 Tax=Rhizopogon vesiculosus TaxID=180088 RepID=A0A1J8Q9E9_9AGAM|nr:hypothetical protein AZE42_11952 [Rhizopogon vesiculosus]
MSITDLWKLVSLTIYGQTLTVFTLEGLRGHVQDEGGISMMTIGVDTSAWLYVVCKLQAFQFGHAQSGENPVMDSDELLNIFGFTWSTAKGEAKDDLAFLSKAGRIVAVLTEDSDAILFGAERVLHLADNNNGTFKVNVYHAGAPSKDLQVPLTTGHLLLWAMLHGGDYNPGGLAECGGQVAQALLKGDLGDSLMHVVTSATPVQLPMYTEEGREVIDLTAD